MHILALSLAMTCDPISGTFEAVDTVCVESPIGLCIDGTFDGDFEADYLGAFETLVPSPTLAQPLRLAYTSSDTYVTATETITGDTSGFIVLNDTVAALVCLLGCNGDAECIGGCVLTHGGCVLTHGGTSFTSTSTFDGGRGGFDASGTGSYLDGVSRGTYSGEICE